MTNGIGILEVEVGFTFPGGFQLVIAAAGRYATQRAGDTAFQPAGSLAHHRHFTPGITSLSVVRRHHGFRDIVSDFDGGPHLAAKRRAQQPITNAADAPADTSLRYSTRDNLRAVERCVRCRHAGSRQHHGHTEGFKGKAGLLRGHQRGSLHITAPPDDWARSAIAWATSAVPYTTSLPSNTTAGTFVTPSSQARTTAR
ncbi:hypothetical protein D3C80_1169720 [compost metagenome]